MPVAGDEFQVVESLDVARQMAEETAAKLRLARLAALQGESKVSLASLAGRGGGGGGGEGEGMEFQMLNVVLKVDCQVSVRALY